METEPALVGAFSPCSIPNVYVPLNPVIDITQLSLPT